MNTSAIGLTVANVTHHKVALNGTKLHYVGAGTAGTPILLVHGFPETWWTFHKIIPMLAENHRVFAVDLRGFGDSDNSDGSYDSSTSAQDLHALIKHLDIGPIHVVAQDISGGTAFRLAANHPGDVASLTAIEMGLAGFGLEALADVTHGGSWHIGVLAAPGIPDMLLKGRELEFVHWAFNGMTAVSGAISDGDIQEFARSYSRPNGWRGAVGLYQSMLGEGSELADLARNKHVTTPILAIGAGGGEFTAATMSKATATKIQSVQLKGVGHYAAMEAPDQVATAISEFIRGVDQKKA